MIENKDFDAAVVALKKAKDGDERGMVLRDFAVKLYQEDYAKLVQMALL